MSRDNLAIQIQQLVDGELSHEERCRLLKHLSNVESGWKQLALGFVEQQIIRESLVPVAREIKTSGFLVPQGDAIRKKSKEDYAASKTRWWVGLVAATLVGFLGGTMCYMSLQSLLPGGDVVLNNAGSDIPEVVKSLGSVQVDEQETVQIGSELDNEKLTLADAMSRSMLPIHPVFRVEMLKAGYEVLEDQKKTRVDLPTGGTIEIPIRDVQINYVGVSVFQ